jgi:hypothetical protein
LVIRNHKPKSISNLEFLKYIVIALSKSTHSSAWLRILLERLNFFIVKVYTVQQAIQAQKRNKKSEVDFKKNLFI